MWCWARITPKTPALVRLLVWEPTTLVMVWLLIREATLIRRIALITKPAALITKPAALRLLVLLMGR